MTAEYEPTHDGAGCKVTAKKQIEAVRMWAEYWGSACPDCGPQDYEFMLQHALGSNTDLKDATEYVDAQLKTMREYGSLVADFCEADRQRMIKEIVAVIAEAQRPSNNNEIA